MTLKELTERYFDTVTRLRSKSPLTIRKERYTMVKWLTTFGNHDPAALTLSDLNEFAMNRGEGVCNRTINLDILALHNVLKFGKETGILAALVTAEWKPLKHKTPRRELIPDDSLARLCAEALRTYPGPFRAGKPCHQNGPLLVDYLKFLAYSGSRRMAGLHAKWDDVDFKQKTVVLHTKFDKDVVVQMNDSLHDHLRDMFKRRRDETPWLFPAPNRKSSSHWTDPESALKPIARAVFLPTLCLHDLRHAFASRAVMLGVDFMTVAAMLGHSDGGVLVSKVYGHLNESHLKAAAKKMTF